MSDDKECCGGHCRGIELKNVSGHTIEMVDHEAPDEENSDQPTEQEEEELERRFFCLYHLKMQWSEYDMLTPFERDWVIQRFIHQKKMEKEIMTQQRTAGGILIPQSTLEI